MGFLAPWFLAGAAAVGLPIWVHLLKRHKTDPKLFPSLMFFEQREQSSVIHRRLDYILLFALRTALVVLLALLFANPFINRAASAGDGKKLTVVAIDRSFSMREGDRLAKAKEEGLKVINGLKPGVQAQVIALSGTVQALTQAVSDPAELRAAVTSVQPGDSRASYGELSRYLRSVSEAQKMPIEAHVVSDLQKSAMPPGFIDLRLDPGTSLVFHPIGTVGPNWAVENVTAPRRVYDPKRVKIQVVVAGFSTKETQKTVTLSLNGRTLQSKTIDIPEGGRGQAEFTGLDAPYGWSKGEAKIDGGDSLAADDRFLFSIERTDPRRVLFVDDGRRPRAETYFRAAIDSSGDGGFQVDKQSPDGAAAATLSNYAFVVLSDVGTVPQALESALQRYVSGGGSLMIVLGPGSSLLPRVPVLDEPIQASNYAGREGERFLSVTDIDAGHPVLRSVDRFTGVKFYQTVRVNPMKSQVLAKLNDGSPLVLERSIGEGKVFTFASTFDNISNDLPIHAAWVPFISQASLYLGGGGAEQPVNLVTDSYVELRSGDQQGAAAEVLDPEGKRVLSLTESTKARNVSVDREGYFDIKTASGRRSVIAVHADRRESDLTPIPQETLDLWKGTGAVDTSTGSGGTGAGSNERPWNLWPYILLVLLGVAVAESIVANRYLHPVAAQTKA